jgi:hypothetical protein
MQLRRQQALHSMCSRQPTSQTESRDTLTPGRTFTASFNTITSTTDDLLPEHVLGSREVLNTAWQGSCEDQHKVMRAAAKTFRCHDDRLHFSKPFIAVNQATATTTLSFFRILRSNDDSPCVCPHVLPMAQPTRYRAWCRACTCTQLHLVDIRLSTQVCNELSRKRARTRLGTCTAGTRRAAESGCARVHATIESEHETDEVHSRPHRASLH